MSDQRNEEQAISEVSDEDRDKCVLMILMDDSGWPWTVEEIGRELESSIAAADSVARLAAAGLVHRFGDVVFPTRAARRAEQLYAGSI